MTGTVNRVRGNGSFAFLTDLDEIPTPEGGIFAHKRNFLDPGLMKAGMKVSFQAIYLEPTKRWEAVNVTRPTQKP